MIEAVQNKKEPIERILASQEQIRSFGVKQLGIFGSFVRDEAKENSDVDFFIDFMVDWREMARMRDKLIHNYFGVDYDIVFNTIKIDIPDLRHELQRIIEIEEKK